MRTYVAERPTVVPELAGAPMFATAVHAVFAAPVLIQAVEPSARRRVDPRGRASPELVGSNVLAAASNARAPAGPPVTRVPATMAGPETGPVARADRS